MEPPPVLVAASVVEGNVGLNPKPVPVAPKTLVLVVGADGAGAAPPKTLPVVLPKLAPNGEDAAVLAPNGLVAEAGAALPKLPPKGDVVAVVVVGALPNPLPKIVVDGADVLAADALGVNPLPPKMEGVGVDTLLPNPVPPKIPCAGDEAVENAPVLDVGATVVLVAAANAPPKRVGVEVAAAVWLLNSGAALVAVLALPKGMLPVAAGVAVLNAGDPKLGLEPKLLGLNGVTGFVVGDVGCTDVVMVEASDPSVPNGDALVVGVGSTAGDVTSEGLLVGALVVNPEKIGLVSWADVTAGGAVLDGTALPSNERIAASLYDVDTAVGVFGGSVAVGSVGLTGGIFLNASDGIVWDAGVAGVTDMAGTPVLTDLCGV